MKKSTMIRFAPLLIGYLCTVALLVFMVHEKSDNILTGLVGLGVFMPLVAGVLFGFSLWAQKVEEKENES